MCPIRSTSATVIAVFWFLCFGLLGQSSPLVPESQVTPEKPRDADQEFLAALIVMDAAQLELQHGNASAYKALWAHTDDVTLVGGFGGMVEKGWERVSQRLDWAAAQFSNGTNTIERLITHTNGQLAYVVQIEHIRFQVPGQLKESTRDYRVTMLFRREPTGWRILHRHADSQLLKQAPQ